MFLRCIVMSVVGVKQCREKKRNEPSTELPVTTAKAFCECGEVIREASTKLPLTEAELLHEQQ